MLEDVDTDEDVDNELDVDTLQKHYMYINLSVCWSNKEVGFCFYRQQCFKGILCFLKKRKVLILISKHILEISLLKYPEEDVVDTVVVVGVE